MSQIIHADGIEHLHSMQPSSVDLVVTSPPYDNLRQYDATGATFHARGMVEAITQVLKSEGVCCWIVADKIQDGDRSLTSFRHAFLARECGLRNHDLIVWNKGIGAFPRTRAYTNCHEFIFVWTKGPRARVFNPIKQPCAHFATSAGHSYPRKTAEDGRALSGNANRIRPCKGRPSHRNIDAEGRAGIDTTRNKATPRPDRPRTNIWHVPVGCNKSATDKIAHEHPAIAPEPLIRDLILSWSNPGDLVVDPMCGSGTTCKMAHLTGRRWLGIDISRKYTDIATRRMRAAQSQQRLEIT